MENVCGKCIQDAWYEIRDTWYEECIREYVYEICIQGNVCEIRGHVYEVHGTRYVGICICIRDVEYEEEGGEGERRE